jgi:hypothetical protein
MIRNLSAPPGSNWLHGAFGFTELLRTRSMGRPGFRDHA